MWACPVCNTSNGINVLCRGCGFDNSTNVISYPTIQYLDQAFSPFQTVARKKWGNSLEKALKCPECGGMTFHILPEQKALVCAFCGGAMIAKKRTKRAEITVTRVLCEDGKIVIAGEWAKDYTLAKNALFCLTDPARVTKPLSIPNVAGDLLPAQELALQIDEMVNGAAELAVGRNHLVSLKQEGSVFAKGNDLYNFGQCEVAEWKDVCSVAASYHTTFGLRKDGTVIGAGKMLKQYEWLESDLGKWNEIVAISAGKDFLIGLKQDGKVMCLNCDNTLSKKMEKWRDVSAVSTGMAHTLALLKDGTVLACGSNANGQCKVERWKYIVGICAGVDFSVGIQSDGTFICTDPSVDLSALSQIKDYEHAKEWGALFR